jgi:hypothetical protein
LLVDITEAEPILPRKLTDLSDMVRSVPPPPNAAGVPDPYAVRLANPDANAEMVGWNCCMPNPGYKSYAIFGPPILGVSFRFHIRC